MTTRARKTTTDPEAKPVAQLPHTIVPTAIYDLVAATTAIGLSRTALKREIKLRRLRVSRRAGRYFFVGSWLLQWIEAGEVIRQRATTDSVTN